MLVTFKTKAYADITMFGDVAVKLLKLMGHSGTVPGAISSTEIPAALTRLKAGIAEEEERSAGADRPPAGDDREEPKVGLKRRAWPLIELLEAAAAKDEYVMWES